MSHTDALIPFSIWDTLDLQLQSKPIESNIRHSKQLFWPSLNSNIKQTGVLWDIISITLYRTHKLEVSSWSSFLCFLLIVFLLSSHLNISFNYYTGIEININDSSFRVRCTWNHTYIFLPKWHECGITWKCCKMGLISYAKFASMQTHKPALTKWTFKHLLIVWEWAALRVNMDGNCILLCIMQCGIFILEL